MSEEQNKLDMSVVVEGSQVRYRDGRKAIVAEVDHKNTYPFRTIIDDMIGGIFHMPNGRCCIDEEYYRRYDIIEVLSNPDAKAVQADIKQQGLVQLETHTPDGTSEIPPIVGGTIELKQSIEEPTLRDLFAIAALQGDWAAQNKASGCFVNQVTPETLQDRAVVYYRMADAMMKASKQA